jgi:hypothetical protein
MTSPQDTGVVWATETTYGTYVAGTRGGEPLGDSLAQSFNKNVVQGQGLRVGSRFPRFARRVVPNSDGTVTLPIEITSKGMGQLFAAMLGSSTVTVVTGATYQHNFVTGDTPPSLSIQEQVYSVGPTLDPYSWSGCMVNTAEFTFTNRGLLVCTITFDCQGVSVAQSYVAPTYPSSPVNLFHFSNLSINTGTFSPATTTTLPSCATGSVNIRGGSLKIDRNLINDDFRANGAGKKFKPTVGAPAVTGSFDVVYDSTTYRDLVLSDNTLSAVVTYTAGALSTGVETIAFALPAIRFDGDLPQPNNDQLVVQSMAWTLGDDLTNVPFGIYQRTSDTTIL